MKRKVRCYIAICEPPKAKQRIKAALALQRGVVRVTDHGEHIKINTTRALRPVPGLLAAEVRDQTKHFDVRYWDFAMEAYRHSLRQKHTREQMLGVMFHYLANLLGVPEPEWCERESAGRRYLNASVTDEEAHGWELPHVARLQKILRDSQKEPSR